MDLVERCNPSPTESSPSSLVRDVVDLSEFVIVGLENKELGSLWSERGGMFPSSLSES